MLKDQAILNKKMSCTQADVRNIVKYSTFMNEKNIRNIMFLLHENYVLQLTKFIVSSALHLRNFFSPPFPREGNFPERKDYIFPSTPRKVG